MILIYLKEYIHSANFGIILAKINIDIRNSKKKILKIVFLYLSLSNSFKGIQSLYIF